MLSPNAGNFRGRDAKVFSWKNPKPRILAVLHLAHNCLNYCPQTAQRQMQYSFLRALLPQSSYAIKFFPH